MKYEITIPGRLPGLNEYIRECRKNAYAGNQMKKIEQRSCEVFIRHAMKGKRIYKPVVIHYRWFEKDMRRDLDNISGMGRKIIQDALVATGVLEDDGWKYVAGFTDEFYVDKRNPRIEVTIEEI